MQRRLQILLVLLLWPTYGWFYQAGEHNEAARLDLVRAFVEDGVLWVDPHIWNSADLISYTRDGVTHWYSGKAPGSSMLAAGPFKLASLLLPRRALGETSYWHGVAYATALVSVSLLSALAAAVAFGLCWRVLGSAWAALFGVLAVWLGTLLFPFSTLQFGHAQAAACLVFATALADRTLREPGTGAARAAFGAGLAAGFAVVVEYPAVLLVAGLGLFLLHGLARAPLAPRRRAGLLARFVAGGLGAALLLAAYNLAAFGTLLYVPYDAYAHGEGQFQAHARGLLGVHWPGLASFREVLAEITVRPQRGILYLGFDGFRVFATNPVLWLALPGSALLAARRETRALGVLAASAALAMLVFNACYGDSIVYWGGGASVGPRHLVPVLPFLALPLARSVRALPWLFFPLFAVSAFYMLLATATEPRAGYEFANPARDLFAARWLEGRFALNQGPLFDFGRGLVTADSTAFNLGKLAGLPGALQLAPLLFWWSVVGALLMRGAARADAAAGVPAPRSRAVRLAIGALAAFAVFVVGTPFVVG